MSVDLIRYDLLVQDALRAVVRRVLNDVAQDGLPGDHHLYISFDTCAPGVRLSPRLKEKYPEEMTIVLQHQFWDLIVSETFFEVGLSFNGIPERLHVPFSSLKGFFDPSVKFGLQFEPAPDEEEAEVEAPQPAPAAMRPTSVPTTRGPVPAARSSQAEAKPAKSGARSESAPAASARPEPRPVAAETRRSRIGDGDEAGVDVAKAETSKAAVKGESAKGDSAKGKGAAADQERADGAKPEAEPAGSPSGAQVVRLDAFRKK
ncbi:SspB family protein [Ancylobacter mangrovi]|uniref:SspB family protein n=1 Tax=Ancylobacter mangrovi TaxID=2972472 RepID=UPI002161BAD0|nr:ClpXP protease specificity-enhancing factor SspB [Ancylobacter mangrovi]MCS0503858.1 ClpXP protease specificity-enhancing factor SspB [Ancylobacter mangrovi]